MPCTFHRTFQTLSYSIGANRSDMTGFKIKSGRRTGSQPQFRQFLLKITVASMMTNSNHRSFVTTFQLASEPLALGRSAQRVNSSRRRTSLKSDDAVKFNCGKDEPIDFRNFLIVASQSIGV